MSWMTGVDPTTQADSKEQDMTAVIEVDNLLKQYKKATSPAVAGVSFQVDEGELFAFLGPNGAGKTTAISILTTTLNKTSGTVRIAGYDVTNHDSKVSEHIAIMDCQSRQETAVTE